MSAESTASAFVGAGADEMLPANTVRVGAESSSFTLLETTRARARADTATGALALAISRAMRESTGTGTSPGLTLELVAIDILSTRGSLTTGPGASVDAATHCGALPGKYRVVFLLESIFGFTRRSSSPSESLLVRCAISPALSSGTNNAKSLALKALDLAI